MSDSFDIITYDETVNTDILVNNSTDELFGEDLLTFFIFEDKKLITARYEDDYGYNISLLSTNRALEFQNKVANSLHESYGEPYYKQDKSGYGTFEECYKEDFTIFI